MTLRVSDWQLGSDLDSVRKSCDVYNDVHHQETCMIWMFQLRGEAEVQVKDNVLQSSRACGISDKLSPWGR